MFNYLPKHCIELRCPLVIMKWPSSRRDRDGLVHLFPVGDCCGLKLVLNARGIFFIHWISGTRLMGLTNSFWTINTIVFFNYVMRKPFTVVMVDSEAGLTKKTQVLDNQHLLRRMNTVYLITVNFTFGLLLFVSGPLIGWQFHSSWKSLQSSLMSSKKSICSSQMWCGFCMSSICILSNRVKNARQRQANWVPTSTHNRSIRVLRVDLELNRIKRQYINEVMALTIPI